MERARPAEAADRHTCTRLLSECLVAAAAMRGGAALIGAATPASLLARWSGDPATRPLDSPGLLVGEYDGLVVGLAAMTTAPVVGGRRGLIECCYVEPPARGVGVGTTLLEAAVAWCASRECTEVDALALPGDRSTKQRLEAAGFSARLLTLSRRLD